MSVEREAEIAKQKTTFDGIPDSNARQQARNVFMALVSIPFYPIIEALKFAHNLAAKRSERHVNLTNTRDTSSSNNHPK